MPIKLQQIDAAREMSMVTDAVEAAKTCRITLSADAPHPIELRWCRGRGDRPSLVILKPGASVDQPLDKCHAWFGPFDLFKVYTETRDERKLVELRDLISTESARFLNRYDYPYVGRGVNPDRTPTGPHRAPDVTITVLNADGSMEEPVRLHEVYGIGAFDEEHPIGSFAQRESEEDIKARFEAQLRKKDELHAAEIEEFRLNQAKIEGLVRGFMHAKKQDAEAPVEADAVPA